jgi:type I restriction enzyme S subunit
MSFPRYPKYKESGVEWLGHVPAHWEVKPLRRLVMSTNAGEVIDRSFWGGTKELLYTCAIDPLDCDYEEFPDWKRTSDEDLLLTRNGTPYVHKPIRNAIYSNVVQRIRLLSGQNREYIAKTLQNSADNLRGYGVSIESLNYEMWKCLPVAIPSLDEQTAIADFLDRETAKIDGLIAEQEHLIELLKEKRQAVISHAVTKGLNPDAPMKDSGIEWLGQVPAHWTISKMKWVAKMESGHTPDKKIPEYWDGGHIPWVSLNDTGYLKSNDYISDTAYQITEAGIENSSAHLLPPKAVVFSRDATIGRCAITTRPMAVSQHFIAWICGDEIIPEYLLMRLRSMEHELERLTTGATLKTIGMPEVRTLVTPVPPLEEQREIIDWMGRQTSEIDTLTSEAQRAITLLQERRSALISAAVTGQIDVRANHHQQAA